MSEKIESLLTEQERLKAENDRLKAQAEIDRQSSLNKIGATKADTYYGLQGANLINQYLTAQQQKKRGAAELARLKGQRPELSPYVKDVRLQQRLAEADQARLTGLSPDAQRIADRQMLQGQLAMDQRARTASGGQAGMYGNLAQQGALARYGAAPEMALAQEEARIGKQQIYDALSERAMLEDQAALARQDAEQLARRGEWQDAMKAAQATEAAGRANLLDIYEQMPYYASNVAGTYTNLNEQRPWRVNDKFQPVDDPNVGDEGSFPTSVYSGDAYKDGLYQKDLDILNTLESKPDQSYMGGWSDNSPYSGAAYREGLYGAAQDIIAEHYNNRTE